jgi:hypothetical protein
MLDKQKLKHLEAEVTMDRVLKSTCHYPTMEC